MNQAYTQILSAINKCVGVLDGYNRIRADKNAGKILVIVAKITWGK